MGTTNKVILCVLGLGIGAMAGFKIGVDTNCDREAARNHVNGSATGNFLIVSNKLDRDKIGSPFVTLHNVKYHLISKKPGMVDRISGVATGTEVTVAGDVFDSSNLPMSGQRCIVVMFLHNDEDRNY